ncbi:MAG: hypothetical protein AB7G44_13840, partial [Bacteroidia bacterium]
MKSKTIINLFALICSITVFTSSKLCAQEQLESWGITSKIFDFDPANPSVPTVTALPTPSALPGFSTPASLYYSGTKASYFQGSYTDCYGELKIFVVDGKVYDGEGFFITDIGLGVNSEVVIVPSMNMPSSSKCELYYIFSGAPNSSTTVNVTGIWFLLSNPNFTGTNRMGAKDNAESFTITLTGGSANCKSLMLASAPPDANGDINVYAATCNKIEKIRYTSFTWALHTAQNVTFAATPSDHSLRSELEIVKLSNGQYKVAHPYLKTTSGVSKWNLALHSLGTTGNFTGTTTYKEVTHATTPNWQTEIIKGLEFSQNGDYLYFSSLLSPYLHYYTYSSNTYTGLPISLTDAGDFRSGQIERARDGKVYFVANNRLASISSSNTPASTWTNSVTGTALGTGFYPYTQGY